MDGFLIGVVTGAVVAAIVAGATFIRRSYLLPDAWGWMFERARTIFIEGMTGEGETSLEIRRIGRGSLYEVEPCVWGPYRDFHVPQRVIPRMDADSPPIKVRVRWRAGDELWVGVVWTNARTHQPFEHAHRINVHTGEYQEWRRWTLLLPLQVHRALGRDGGGRWERLRERRAISPRRDVPRS